MASFQSAFDPTECGGCAERIDHTPILTNTYLPPDTQPIDGCNAPPLAPLPSPTPCPPIRPGRARVVYRNDPSIVSASSLTVAQNDCCETSLGINIELACPPLTIVVDHVTTVTLPPATPATASASGHVTACALHLDFNFGIPRGTNGSRGLRGSRGIMGSRGPRGFTGLTGPTGATGATGLTGPRGYPGSRGLRGTPGTSSMSCRDFDGVHVVARNDTGVHRLIYDPVLLDDLVVRPVGENFSHITYAAKQIKSDCLNRSLSLPHFAAVYAICLDDIPVGHTGCVMVKGVSPLWLGDNSAFGSYLAAIGGTRQILTRVGGLTILWMSAHVVDLYRGGGRWAVAAVDPALPDGFWASVTKASPSADSGGYANAYDWVELMPDAGGQLVAFRGNRTGHAHFQQPAYVVGGGVAMDGTKGWMRPGKSWFRKSGHSLGLSMSICPATNGAAWPLVVQEWLFHPSIGNKWRFRCDGLGGGVITPYSSLGL